MHRRRIVTGALTTYRILVTYPLYQGIAFSRALEFVHFGLTAKYQLTTALARLRERADREAVGEGFAESPRRKQPPTPGFAVPSPLGEGRYQPRPAVNPNVENSRARLSSRAELHVVQHVGFSPCSD